MSSGQRKIKRPMNKTIIKDGHIVRVEKNGRIKEIVDTFPPSKK